MGQRFHPYSFVSTSPGASSSSPTVADSRWTSNSPALLSLPTAAECIMKRNVPYARPGALSSPSMAADSRVNSDRPALSAADSRKNSGSPTMSSQPTAADSRRTSVSPALSSLLTAEDSRMTSGSSPYSQPPSPGIRVPKKIQQTLGPVVENNQVGFAHVQQFFI